jgi:antitoxin VapB
MSGRSQVGRLPKEFRFDCDEVLVERDGMWLTLTPRPRSWREYFASAPPLSDDFPVEIEDKPPEECEPLWRFVLCSTLASAFTRCALKGLRARQPFAQIQQHAFAVGQHQRFWRPPQLYFRDLEFARQQINQIASAQ